MPRQRWTGQHEKSLSLQKPRYSGRYSSCIWNDYPLDMFLAIHEPAPMFLCKSPCSERERANRRLVSGKTPSGTKKYKQSRYPRITLVKIQTLSPEASSQAIFRWNRNELGKLTKGFQHPEEVKPYTVLPQARLFPRSKDQAFGSRSTQPSPLKVLNLGLAPSADPLGTTRTLC